MVDRLVGIVLVAFLPHLDVLLLPELSSSEIVRISSFLERVPVVRVPVSVVVVALEANAARTVGELLGLRVDVKEQFALPFFHQHLGHSHVLHVSILFELGSN